MRESVSIAVLLHFCRSGDRRAARDLYAAAHCGAPQPPPPVNAKCCCGAISLRALTRPKLLGLLCCLCRKQINEPRNHGTRCAVPHYVINNTSTHTHTDTRAIGRESYNTQRQQPKTAEGPRRCTKGPIVLCSLSSYAGTAKFAQVANPIIIRRRRTKQQP